MPAPMCRRLAPRLVARPGLRLALALFAIDLGAELGRPALQNLVSLLRMGLGHVLEGLAIPPDLLALRHRSAPHVIMPTAFRRFASSPWRQVRAAFHSFGSVTVSTVSMV